MSSVLTVSQLNNYIAFKLKTDIKLRGIMVQGEISNFTNHYKSGHLYFTLKDKESLIKAVMFSSSASKLKFLPYDGMQVIVSGNIEVYSRDGVYQIYALDMQPAGIGALYIAFEQLKEKLYKEGLFDEIHKKPIPNFPKKIGIITSSSGAGLQDIINILSRRYPVCEICIFSAIVQGELSAKSLIENIKAADIQKLDVIIIGRGGGSFEDLFSFNDENVARAVFDCKTPVISAVGHETDTTIIDFVSDLRAPTPSAAAELVAPDISTMLDTLNFFKAKLFDKLNKRIERYESQINIKSDKIKSYYPVNLLTNKLSEVDKSQKRLYNSYSNILRSKELYLNKRISLLNSLSPLNILARGYSLVYKNDEIVRSSDGVEIGDKVILRFSDTQAVATITEK